MDGKFVLKVDRGDKVQFSFIGYARHEYLALKTEKKPGYPISTGCKCT